ncbi:hypothetical protein [Clostridium butyricum]|uniref:Uncharacterized protein n=1 Tax=Clostridium butyricum TaxID=1492 RepID=A0A2S7FA56_CLOBU|nr:hypothetical protein [Clostridium butyricum]KHD15419.1 hypothetical protein OA81_10510 [Clostridium butyricum]PPV14323.1 hypothetical protein AWN73_14045 [Clostridium butyricum]
MALGFLFLLFIGMSILAIVGIVLLFVVKKNNTNDVLLVLMTAYSMSIAFLNATAQPTNFVGTQILAWVVGLVAIIGTAITLLTRKHLLISKILVSGSVILGIYFLYFG